MNKLAVVASMLLAGCQSQTNAGANSGNDASPAPAAPAEQQSSETTIAPARQTPHEAENIQKPVERSSLPEPKGPIDPKSVEAAGQVVQHFGALIESNRYIEAGKLWSDAATAAKFMNKLRPGVHIEIGELGATEGAAGSIYTTIPVTFYDTGFRRPAQIILRRVNDVPGSTEAQRRWHIERIDWQ